MVLRARVVCRKRLPFESINAGRCVGNLCGRSPPFFLVGLEIDDQECKNSWKRKGSGRQSRGGYRHGRRMVVEKKVCQDLFGGLDQGGWMSWRGTEREREREERHTQTAIGLDVQADGRVVGGEGKRAWEDRMEWRKSQDGRVVGLGR